MAELEVEAKEAFDLAAAIRRLCAHAVSDAAVLSAVSDVAVEYARRMQMTPEVLIAAFSECVATLSKLPDGIDVNNDQHIAACAVSLAATAVGHLMVKAGIESATITPQKAK